MNIANMYGGEVIGFDLSAAVEKAKRDTAHNPFSHVIQADIMTPPFKKQIFDFIYSIGVLHHTPDPKKSFKYITPLLKNRGKFSLCVYEKSHYYIKELVERIIRKITTRLPFKLLFYLSYLGVPLGWLQSRLRKNPVTFILGAPLFLIPGCEHWDWRIRHTNTFDLYVAPYQWKHTHEEIIKWFEEEGFEDIQILPDNPICIKAVKR
jgi:SAM-dependent methyltransferase